MRLQKYLAEAGVASRRASEAIISEGRVLVNGVVATLGMSVDIEKDEVVLDGKPVSKREERVVILFYKPRGVVCTSDDPEGRPTVQSYFRSVPARLYNVGRLDLNSEGLLLMTNDGDMAYRLTHPKFGVAKTYYAVLDGEVTDSEVSRLTNGVELDDGMTAPARVEFVRRTQRGDTSMMITIHEGRNRQIRRMAEAIGHRTLRLKRERFGPFSLGDMKSGEWRYLSETERAALEKLLSAPLPQKKGAPAD